MEPPRHLADAEEGASTEGHLIFALRQALGKGGQPGSPTNVLDTSFRLKGRYKVEDKSLTELDKTDEEESRALLSSDNSTQDVFVDWYSEEQIDWYSSNIDQALDSLRELTGNNARSSFLEESALGSSDSSSWRYGRKIHSSPLSLSAQSRQQPRTPVVYHEMDFYSTAAGELPYTGVRHSIFQSSQTRTRTGKTDSCEETVLSHGCQAGLQENHSGSGANASGPALTSIMSKERPRSWDSAVKRTLKNCSDRSRESAPTIRRSLSLQERCDRVESTTYTRLSQVNGGVFVEQTKRIEAKYSHDV